MRRLTAYFLVFALGAASAVALVSCGGGESAELLPGNTASEISENLDSVAQLAGSGDCVGAQDQAQQVSDQIAALGGVDKELKQALRKGAARLNEVVAVNCSPETTESVAPASIPETTESTTTETTTKKPSKKTPTTTVEPNTTPTTPTTTPTPTTPTVPPTTPTTTTPTTPPAEDGGTGAPSGGVAPGAESGGE